MSRNLSIATIDAPEFIQLKPYNHLISECEIKVCYLGLNRNGSYISREVAEQMANTLPGTPIVAYFDKSKDDFGDHGSVITIEDGEIKFSCKTVPYGFIAPDAKVWFQNFLEVDESGEQVERQYLMTTGYLWTGQFPEVKKAMEEELPQSMELDEESLDGRWATDNSSGVKFFIINDAVFSKLCILGSDVEPCFEGACVTAPKISKEFSQEPEFVFTLLKMREELYDALSICASKEHNNSIDEGGSGNMSKSLKDKQTQFAAEDVDTSKVSYEESADDGASAVDESSTDLADEPSDANEPSADPAGEAVVEDGAEEPSETLVGDESLIELAVDNGQEGDVSDSTDEAGKKKKPLFACGDKKKKYAEEDEEEEADKEKKKKNPQDADTDSSEEDDDSDSDEDKDEYKKKKCGSKCTLDEDLEAKFAATVKELISVKEELALANKELDSLREFKLEIENNRKEELINSYHMLSDSVRAELSENKANYSYDNLEAKLALAYVKEFADFGQLDGKAAESKEESIEEDSPLTTFNLDGAVDSNFTPSWVQEMIAARD